LKFNLVNSLHDWQAVLCIVVISLSAFQLESQEALEKLSKTHVVTAESLSKALGGKVSKNALNKFKKVLKRLGHEVLPETTPQLKY
jgi:hypothetical protein